MGDSEVKVSACSAGDQGSVSALGRFPWRRKCQPPPVFLPGESHGQRSLVGYSPWGHKELDTTEWLHFHFHTLFPSGCINLHFNNSTNAKFRHKLKKVGKTTRPFGFDLNQIPYCYTVEVTNRFKGLDLIECLMNCGRRFVTLYRRQWSRQSSTKRNAKTQNGCLRRPYR